MKLESRWKQFRNPWNQELEYIICRNYIIFTQDKLGDGGSFGDSGDMDFFNAERGNTAVCGRVVGKNIQRVITSHAEAAKIGHHIAEEVMDKWRSDSSASNSPLSHFQVQFQVFSRVPFFLKEVTVCTGFQFFRSIRKSFQFFTIRKSFQFFRIY